MHNKEIGGDNPTSKPDTPPQAPKTPVKAQKKTQYQILNELINGTKFSLASANDWILKQFGSEIKINDLTKEQFDLLYRALQKAISKEQ